MMVTLLLVSIRHPVAGHRSQSLRSVRPGLFARETFNPRRCNHLLSPYFILRQSQRGKSACYYLGLEAQRIQNAVLRRRVFTLLPLLFVHEAAGLTKYANINSASKRTEDSRSCQNGSTGNGKSRDKQLRVKANRRCLKLPESFHLVKLEKREPTTAWAPYSRQTATSRRNQLLPPPPP
ncbi:unnamed protein product, partial [Ectocarpus sp. 12 AP-2014]